MHNNNRIVKRSFGRGEGHPKLDKGTYTSLVIEVGLVCRGSEVDDDVAELQRVYTFSEGVPLFFWGRYLDGNIK